MVELRSERRRDRTVESREAYVAVRREAELTARRGKAEQWSEIWDKFREDSSRHKNMLYGLAN